MVEKADEMNLSGIMLVLVNGNITHLKVRENCRLMMKFALKGIPALSRER